MINKELEQYLSNKEWRLSHLYFIVNKEAKLVRFKRNKAQQRFNLEKWVLNIILKIRQKGFTTDACIDGLDDCLFSSNFNMAIIAQDKESQRKIFKKVKIAWENIDQGVKDYMGWKVNVNTSNELSFSHGSTIRVTLSTRADTLNRLHISEFGKICAKYPLKAEEIITGAIPSVVPGGRIDIESTAEGEFGQFYDMFWDAWGREPKNNMEFKAHFFSLKDDDEYVLEGDYDLPDDIIELGKKYGLHKNQLNWYYFTKGKLKEKMAQEYPITPEEAFMSSGNKWFTQESIDYQKIYIEEGTKIGNWTYYRDYKVGHVYGLGADVSEGVGRDSSTIAILDFSTMEVVATYRNNKIAPDLFAHEIKNGGLTYGGCLVAPELNNHGHATMATLKTIYSNIYKQVRTDKKRDEQTEKLGWSTNLATKPKMLSELKTILDEEGIKLLSRDLLNEVRTYNADDLNSVSFDENMTTHWDLLIALSIAFQLRTVVFKNIKSEINNTILVEANRISNDSIE